ncbi:MAG: hypothetical protein M0Z47_00165 [Actinomycetota bacterium]|nr:hypothetical protein [Actinomycetota bacterium]
MNTPWGRSDHIERFEVGIQQVGTPSHGGLMISRTKAERLLPEPALRRAERCGGYYCWEEDCDWAIAMWHLPRLWERYFAHGSEYCRTDPRGYMLGVLSRYHTDYLQEIGVEPDPEGLAQWNARRASSRMRQERHPDLIVAARRSWHTNDAKVVEVITADGLLHLVTEDSYHRARKDGWPLTLLSKCVLVATD